MRRFAAVTMLALVIATFAGAWRAPHAADGPGGTPPGPPPGAPPGGRGGMAGMPVDSFAAERDSTVKAILARIAGRENAPAESVFKNIKVLQGTPAGRMLRMMDFGYSRSLGVRCTHCHVADRWDSDEKKQKQVARDMRDMVAAINETLLPKIKNLQSEQPGVNCTTCHHGIARPGFGPMSSARPPGGGGPSR